MDQSTIAQSLFEEDVSKLTISPRLVSYEPNEIERTTSPSSSTSSVYLETRPATPPPQLFEPLDYRKDWSKEIVNTFSVATIVPKLRNISTLSSTIWWRMHRTLCTFATRQSTGYLLAYRRLLCRKKRLRKKGLKGMIAAISFPRWHERTSDNTSPFL